MPEAILETCGSYFRGQTRHIALFYYFRAGKTLGTSRVLSV